MILRPSRNLNTLKTIIHRAFPTLQLQPSIGSIGEEQRVPREPLNGLRVELLGGREIAVLESLVALLFESVGGGGGHEVFFDLPALRSLWLKLTCRFKKCWEELAGVTLCMWCCDPSKQC
jgi:hypothetical protein